MKNRGEKTQKITGVKNEIKCQFESHSMMKNDNNIAVAVNFLCLKSCLNYFREMFARRKLLDCIVIQFLPYVDGITIQSIVVLHILTMKCFRISRIL